MRLLFLIGPPNSGKSTQTKLLCKNVTTPPTYNVSPGEWLRDLATHAERSDLGDFVLHNWSHDSLTPLVTDYLDSVVGEMLEKFGGGEFNVIVDGFPRSVAEAHALPHICRGHPFLVLELCPSEETIRGRGETRQRGNDDTEAALDIRLGSYERSRDQIMDALRQCGGSFLKLSSEDSVERVHGALAVVVKSPDMLRRVTIPPVVQKKTLARKLFSEAGAMDSACIIQKTLRLAQSTRLRKQFFGTHPISFTRINMPRVRRYPYLVALKATGVRFLCLVYASRLWLVSRDLTVYESPPIAGLSEFESTLLDGELIGMEEASYYIVLDCLAANGKNCMRQPILERLRNSVMLGKFMYKGPLFFRPQMYVDRGHLSMLLQRASELPWKIDGVILQPARLPYRLGIDYNMFKWKPLYENTADFYFNQEDSGLYCRLSQPDAKEKRPDSVPLPINIDGAPIITKERSNLVKFGRLLDCFKPAWLRDGMIIECSALDAGKVELELLKDKVLRESWNNNELVWIPQQHRADKSTANVDWVAQSVVQSIIDNITLPEFEHLCTSGKLSQDDMPDDAAALVPHATKKRPMY